MLSRCPAQRPRTIDHDRKGPAFSIRKWSLNYAMQRMVRTRSSRRDIPEPLASRMDGLFITLVIVDRDGRDMSELMEVLQMIDPYSAPNLALRSKQHQRTPPLPPSGSYKLLRVADNFEKTPKLQRRSRAKDQALCRLYLNERHSPSSEEISETFERVDDGSGDQSKLLFDEDSLHYGKRSIEAWKNSKGRGKEWRTCPVIKHTSKTFREIGHQTNMVDPSCDWVVTDTAAPVTCLMARQGFRRSIRLSPPAQRNERKKGCKQLALLVQDSRGTSDSPERENPSHSSETTFRSIIMKLEPMSEATHISNVVIPYESYVGAVLGGQFRLGRLVRHEKIADVYEITPLLSNSQDLMEALAYSLKDHPKACVREIAFRKAFISCVIDQSGRKYLVYRIEERKQFEAEARRTKKRNKRKSSKPNKPHGKDSGSDQ